MGKQENVVQLMCVGVPAAVAVSLNTYGPKNNIPDKGVVASTISTVIMHVI